MSHEALSLVFTKEDLYKTVNIEQDEASKLYYTMLSVISRKILNSNQNNITSIIDECLAIIGENIDLDRVYLFLIDHDHEEYSNTNEWVNDGIIGFIDELQHISFDTFPWVGKMILENEPIIIEDRDTIKEQANRFYQELVREEIQSIILIPISLDNEIVGFIGGETCNRTTTWKPRFMTILSLIGEIFINSYFREQYRISSTERADWYEKMIEYSPAGIIIHQDEIIIYANNKANEILEISEDDIIGRRIDCFLHPDDKEKSDRRKIELFEFDHTPYTDYRIITEKGNEIYIESASVMIKHDNKPAIQLFFQDITQKRQDREEIKKSEKLYRSLIDISNDGVIICDPELSVIRVNDSVQEMLGYSREDLLGKKFSDFVIKPENFEENIRKHSIANNKLTLEIKVQCRDQSTKIIKMISSFEQYHDGNIAHQAILRDISQEVKEREIEFHRQKLESLGIITSGIAHDFNNLLMAITGYASYGKQLTDNQELAELFDKILNGSDTAAKLIDQLNTFSGTAESKVELHNINDLIIQYLDFVKLAISRSIQIEVNPADELPLTLIDKTQFSQILLNLVKNAGEAIEEDNTNKRRIILSTTVVPELKDTTKSFVHQAPDFQQGPLIMLSVKDTGIGISSSAIKKIFDPFYTTKFTGRGLGLANVLGIINLHHGAIKIESNVGVGTEFSIYFPITETQSNSTYLAEPKTPADTSSKFASIFIIDDEVDAREVTGKILRFLGYEIHAGGSFDELKSLLDEHYSEKETQLLLMDVEMPGKTGIEIIHNQLDQYEKLKIVLMSGHHRSFIRDQLNKKGTKINGFLQKPYTMEDLKELMNSL